MNFRLVTMESFLVVGVVFFLYTSQVRTTIHDDIIKELKSGLLEDVKYQREMETERSKKSATVPLASKRDETKMEDDAGKALKREITQALVKIISDELEKESTFQLLKKQIIDSYKEKDLTNVLVKKEANDKITERRAANQVMASDDHDVKSESSSLSSLRKRHEEKQKDAWRKDQDTNTVADTAIHRNDLRGPPGLWGRDISDHGPPGLWGKDAARAFLAAEKMAELSDELSTSRLFQKDEKDDISNKHSSNV